MNKVVFVKQAEPQVDVTSPRHRLSHRWLSYSDSMHGERLKGIMQNGLRSLVYGIEIIAGDFIFYFLQWASIIFMLMKNCDLKIPSNVIQPVENAGRGLCFQF